LKKKFKIEFLLLFILGGLTSLSLPPFNLFILNFFTFSGFFVFLFKKLDERNEKKNFFFYGWFFGFGYFLTNLYWVTISLTFDKNFSFLIPFALIFIPSFLALFYGLITLIFYLFNPKNILSAFFGFAVFFGIIEFIRGIILTGFPWNLIVYSFSKNLNFLSILSVIGTYSLNLIVISLFTAPAIYILRKSKKEIGICIFLLLLPIIFFVHGNFQKKQFQNKEIKEIPYTIRIIGSNISLNRFYKDIQTEEVINELISISSPVSNKKIFFIWPEGIIPNTYQNEMFLYSDIFDKSFTENHLIGLGITKKETENDKNKFYNSFSIFDNKLNFIENYNKIKLVPFGEFLPFEKILNLIGLQTVTNNFGSFTEGNKRDVIKINNNLSKELKFLPLICYEIIYSGNLTKNTNFDLIINISEDGWFGESIGPKQHFAHSIYRAIENGKYILRSSNNGMPAIINPLGEIEKYIEFGKSGYIDFEKKRDLNKTIFSIYGNKIFMILILLYIFLAFSFNRIRNE
jgi:apolipoprotein N-acyltransferase